MADRTGADVLLELCGNPYIDPEAVASADGTPCRMPCVTSTFVPNDRPPPVPCLRVK